MLTEYHSASYHDELQKGGVENPKAGSLFGERSGQVRIASYMLCILQKPCVASADGWGDIYGILFDWKGHFYPISALASD